MDIRINFVDVSKQKNTFTLTRSFWFRYKSSRPNDDYLEMCFEILGFDIMIDSDLKPWLIEVFFLFNQINHTPSFQTDSNLDLLVKKNLILDTFLILDIKNKDK